MKFTSIRIRKSLVSLVEKLILTLKYSYVLRTAPIYPVNWYQGFRHTYHDVLRLVATYAMAYDCIVVRAYACCHLSRYIISVVFCSLIPLVVSASLNSQYNWVSPWFWLRPVHYRTSDQDILPPRKIVREKLRFIDPWIYNPSLPTNTHQFQTRIIRTIRS